MKRNRLFLFAMLAAVLLVIQLSAHAQAQTTDPVLVGAGDISGCAQDRDEATAKLLDGIAGTVITLGDNVYPDATAALFTDCYGPTWGRHKARTMPSVGNHDYKTLGAAGYFGYFGSAASPLDTNCTSDCKGYYSYNLGTWHIVVLNTKVDFSPGSAQEQWLRADLAANQTACSLAYWHEPLYSSGTHGNATRVRPLWEILYQNGADVVLNGHDHRYERFAPQNPNGQADLRGIREFVVGTGGTALYPQNILQPNSEISNDTTWGVIKLTLHPTSYDWEFVPIAGQTFRDAGSANCVTSGGTPPTQTPTAAAPTITPTLDPSLPTPTDTPTGVPFTATPMPPVPTATNTPGSGPDLIFADSFENGLTAWTSSSVDLGDLSVVSTSGGGPLGLKQLQALIDDTNTIFVTDDRPLTEPRYRARFYLNPNSLTMASGDAFLIFNGFKGTSGAVFRVELGMGAGGYQIRVKAANDAASWVNSPWFQLSNAVHSIEVDWRAADPGANNGGVTLWVDGAQAGAVGGIDNDTLRVDRVRLGAVASVDPGTHGTFLLDAFESRRQTYIGPLP